MLAHPEVNEALGMRAPRAMLLYGEPGVDKTPMIRHLIELSGCEAVVCGKDD